MIIVQAEITVESIAEAIDQLRDYQVEQLASNLVLNNINQALALEQAIEAKFKEFK